MHSKRMLVLAVVLTICAVPVTVSAAANDVSNAPLAQQETTTTTDTMGNGTMNDSMDDSMTTTDSMGDDEMTTTDTMDDGTSDDEMTTTDTMDDGTTDDGMTDETMTDDGTTDDQMTDETMTDDGMTDDNTNDGGSGNSDTSLPGFGVGVALVALAAGALYVARSR